MAVFVVRALDRPGAAEVRAQTRPAHLAYLAGLPAGVVLLAGPLLAEDGATVLGSLLIYQAPDRAAVEALCAADPYAQAGLFATVEVQAFRWVVNPPEGLA